ncbi:MAG: hypothetical protein R3C19_07615 [Planctomycetaceae bacterium]
MRKRVVNQRRQSARHRWQTALAGLTVAVLFAGLAPGAHAQSNMQELAEKVGVRVLSEGQSGDVHKEAAVRAIPMRVLNAAGRKRVNDVLRDCAQHRSLPHLQYVVEPAMYRYLVEHPDVAVSTWRAMEISQFEMWQTGPYEYEVSASDGSFGTADVIYRDGSQCLFVCEGTYNSPLLPKAISASALILLRYNFVRAADGSVLVDQTMDAFVALPGNTAQTIAKLASPLTNVIMDRNLFEVSLYARMMSKAAMTEPGWVEQLAGQLDGVLPQRRDELTALVQRPAPRGAASSSTAAADGTRNTENGGPRDSAEFQIFESSLSRMNAALPVVPLPQPAPPPQRKRVSARAAARSAAKSDASPEPAGSRRRGVGLTEPLSKAQPYPPPAPISATIPAPADVRRGDSDAFQLQDVVPPVRQPVMETGPVRKQ